MDESGKTDSVPEKSGEVTALLHAWHAGDEDAYRRVAALLYPELRQQAGRYMKFERTGDTLQTTALVHEVFLRLVDAGSVDWQHRQHFLAIAARTMRRVLVDLARASSAAKRGDGATHVPLDSAIPGDLSEPADVVALDEVLEKLAAVDQRKVRVIELRFFAGLSVEETADVLEVSPDTVTRDWRFARSWLKRELSRHVDDRRSS
jgi:RNA polymerase sigma factor (TIGR02999 family)